MQPEAEQGGERLPGGDTTYKRSKHKGCSRVLAGQPMWRAGWYEAAQSLPGPCPRHAAQLHDHPDSEQQEDTRDEHWFIFSVTSPRETSVVHVCAVLMSVTIAVARGHVDVPDPCCGRKASSAVLLGIDGCRSIAENG